MTYNFWLRGWVATLMVSLIGEHFHRLIIDQEKTWVLSGKRDSKDSLSSYKGMWYHPLFQEMFCRYTMLRQALKVMLDVQELDIQMIRLTRLKRERIAELEKIRSLRDDLHHQVVLKESEVIELKKQAKIMEAEMSEISSKSQKLEAQQSTVKKVEEFNALTHEISSLERERSAKEQRLSGYYDKLVVEEDFLKNLKSSFNSTKTNCDQMEQEIKTNIEAINQEGKEIMARRSSVAAEASPEILPIYEKLLQNKKDRVIVPIENRCCSGCHIMVTAQHENLVRKGEKLVFCEHCSRIHYWHDHLYPSEGATEGAPVVKRRKKAEAS